MSKTTKRYYTQTISEAINNPSLMCQTFTEKTVELRNVWQFFSRWRASGKTVIGQSNDSLSNQFSKQRRCLSKISQRSNKYFSEVWEWKWFLLQSKLLQEIFARQFMANLSERAQIAAKTLVEELERGWLTSLVSSRLAKYYILQVKVCNYSIDNISALPIKEHDLFSLTSRSVEFPFFGPM